MKTLIFLSLFLTSLSYADKLTIKEKIKNEITCPRSGFKVSSLAEIAKCPEYFKTVTKERRPLLGEQKLKQIFATKKARYLCSSGKVTIQEADCNGKLKTKMYQCNNGLFVPHHKDCALFTGDIDLSQCESPYFNGSKTIICANGKYVHISNQDRKNIKNKDDTDFEKSIDERKESTAEKR